MKYRVNNLYECIQGEGVHTGRVMTMIRLHGCPVGCVFCDTKETWEPKKQNERILLKQALGHNEMWAYATPFDIIELMRPAASYFVHPWALVSGGEPALQDLKDLVKNLHAAQYQAAIETSGIATGHLDAEFDWVTVSPKMDMPGGYELVPAAIASADEIKFTVGREEDIVNLERLISKGWMKEGATICLQPISQSRRATELCIDKCIATGWRLSAQVHKILGLP